jgi:hypothetical protein
MNGLPRFHLLPTLSPQLTIEVGLALYALNREDALDATAAPQCTNIRGAGVRLSLIGDARIRGLASSLAN